MANSTTNYALIVQRIARINEWLTDSTTDYADKRMANSTATQARINEYN